jgi:hypothetical protein
MELVEGESLGAEIRKMRDARKGGGDSRTTRQRSDIHRIVRLFVGIADALAVVHRQGIIHRDIKPLNLLMTPERDRLLLSDFGLALDAKTSRVTRRGDFLGTIRYMSPELLLAQRVTVDHRTDIWSFGVSLYEVVTLELPFSGDSEEAYIASVSMRDAADARRHNLAIPAELEAILCKCLERDPKNRYQSAVQLREDLELFLEDRPPRHARRRGPLRRSIRFARRHWKPVIAAVAAGVLVAVALGSWTAWRAERRKQDWVRSTLRKLGEDHSPTGGLGDKETDLLKRYVRDAVKDDPHGETAALARRASLLVFAELPHFALANPKPPRQQAKLKLGAGVRFHPGAPLDYFVTWETSWDGQPFRTVCWCILDSVRERTGPGGEPSLSDIAGTPTVTPVPHRIHVRTTVWNLRDGDRRGDPRLRDFTFADDGGVSEGGAPPARLLEALEPDVIEKTVRELQTLSISVFDDYPPDFPRPVLRAEAEATAGLCFLPDRVSLVYARVPSSNGERLVFPHRGKDMELSFYPPWIQDHLPYLLVEVAWRGRAGKEGCTPVAGRQEIRTGSTQEIVLSVDGVFMKDDHDASILSPFTNRMPSGGQWGLDADTPGFVTYSNIRAHRWVSAAPVVGAVEGIWSSMPSRSVALGSDDVEYYLAETASFPVTIEARVVNATWRSSPAR